MERAMSQPQQNKDDRNDAIENAICDRAPTDGAFAIAYAILLLRNQVSDIGEQLYRIAELIDTFQKEND